MRVRERYNGDKLTEFVRVKEYPPGTFTDITETFQRPLKIGTYERMVDWVTPRFRERSSKGEVIVNRLYKFSEDYKVSAGGASWFRTDADSKPAHNTSGPYMIFLRGDGAVDHMPLDDPGFGRLSVLAGTDAAANVESPAFQGLVSIAELRETIQLLRNPVKSWTDFLKKAKRQKNSRDGYRGKPVAEFISDSWLTYRYGVRPIVADASNLFEAVRQKCNPRLVQRRTARGYASTSISGNDEYIAGGVKCTRNTTVKLSSRAGILYDVLVDSSPFGFDVEQLPIAAWETIPFSFVADWFVNVGSYIQAITPKWGVKQLGQWTTNARETSTTAFSERNSFDYANYEYPNPGFDYEQLVTKTITRVPNIDVGLSLEMTPFKGDIGKKRIVDAITLGEQILRSR